MVIVCHQAIVEAGGFPEEVFVIDAPNNTPVWMAQSFICYGVGTMQFLEQNCICNCAQEPEPCFSGSCRSEIIRDFASPCVGPLYQGTLIGKHYGKVRVSNPCAMPQRIRYWWQYVESGVMRTTTSAVLVPANSTIRLCFSVIERLAGDGIRHFKAYQLYDCPGIMDPPPGGGGCVLSIQVVGDRCCDAHGQNCIERASMPDPLPCIP